jgi:hypothetical protein
MQDILTWLAANGRPTSFVSLAADNGSVGFYARFGLVACGPEEPRMVHPVGARLPRCL